MAQMDQQSLQALAAVYRQKVESGEMDPMEAAQKLQEMATGKSESMDTGMSWLNTNSKLGTPQQTGPDISPRGLMDSQFQQDVGNVLPQGDTQIMSPGYNNQGPPIDFGNPPIDITMVQHPKRPSQNLQGPPNRQMVENPTQPMNTNMFGGQSYPSGHPAGTFEPTLQQNAMTKLGMMNRDKATGPLSGMGSGLQNIFGKIGGGLKSAGSSLGGYTEKLFNDPNRMALLQGGLSMMDPNSYYDKQGFGSVFTGLNKGFGAAQGGMKGVFDRRKSLADIQKTKADAQYAASGKGNENTAEYERHVKVLMDPTSTKAAKAYAQKRVDKLTDPGTDYDTKKKDEYIWEKEMPNNIQKNDSLHAYVDTMNATLDSPVGIAFGKGADTLTSIFNFLETRMGQDLGEEGEKYAKTKAFMSRMGVQVGQVIGLFGAGTGLSDADRVFAIDIAGANPSDFTEASLRHLLVLNEGQMRGEVMKANKRISEMYGGEGNVLPGMLQELPGMSENLKRHIAKQIKAGTYRVSGKPVTERPEGWVDSFQGEWESLQPKGGGWSVREVK